MGKSSAKLTSGILASSDSHPLHFQYRLYCPEEYELRPHRPPYLVIVRPFVFQNTNEDSCGTLARRDTDHRAVAIFSSRERCGLETVLA